MGSNISLSICQSDLLQGYKMKMVFNDGSTILFNLNETKVAGAYHRLLKHLQHVDIPFRDWDNPLLSNNCIDRLIEYGRKIGVSVDRSRCESHDQRYLNDLHEIYERRYDGDPSWLDYHEQIHLCEKIGLQGHRFLHIDFREKAGMLIRPFDLKWLDESTTEIKAGDVFVRWAELGKTPYSYWSDDEPDQPDRLNELAKPWLELHPKIMIALEDWDCLASTKVVEFSSWWKPRHDAWCRHWGIPKWDLGNMFSVLVFGKVDAIELSKLKTCLIENKRPKRVMQ